jgi:hypothetical protein
MKMSASEWIARFQTVLASTMRLQGAVLQAADHLPGFQFDETMSGSVFFTGGELGSGERRIVLRLRAQAPRLGDYLRGGRTALTGTVSIEGLAESVPLEGSLFIWPHRRVIRYELSFSVAGHYLLLVGQKNVRVLDFSHTMTTLPAELLDDAGAQVGHCTVVFDWADLPAFLRSFRPMHGISSGVEPSAA